VRSAAEIAFRLRQEGMNFSLFLRPPTPRLTAPPSPLAELPAPGPVAAAWRGSAYAAEVVRLAGEVLAGRYDVLGRGPVSYGNPPAWRRDPASGVESGLVYFRRLPYLDPARVGDQKLVWEINRHAHLVTLAQAALFTGEDRYTAEAERQLWHWWEQNPFQRGINWTAALEVAFRAMSWVWLYHLAGGRLSEAARQRLMQELFRHGRHLEYNLSVYASPNTHLLGEAVALHALGRLFPDFPGAARWRETGRRVVQQHMETGVLDDGFYFEQSTYYHVYALDMFLFHALLEPVPESYRRRLGQMMEMTAALAGPGRVLRLLGDDDGGRWFHPYGRRGEFCRGTLAAAGRFLGRNAGAREEDHAVMGDWWMGPRALAAVEQPEPRESRRWAASGLVTLTAHTRHVVLDGGPMGAGTAGHSHADALSLVVYDGERELLHDPGTFCYLSDPAGREWFRSPAAHNTVRVEGREQAEPAGLFSWRARPRVAVEQWESDGRSDWLRAVCTAAGYRHTRQVLFLKDQALLLIWDEVEAAGGPADIRIEQNWHTPVKSEWNGEGGCPLGGGARLWLLTPGAERQTPEAWRSPAYGHRERSWCIRVRNGAGAGPVLAAAVDWRGEVPMELTAAGEIRQGGLRARFHAGGERPWWSVQA